MPAPADKTSTSYPDWLVWRRPTGKRLPGLSGTPKRWQALAPPAEDFWPRLGFNFALAGALFPLLIGAARVVGIAFVGLAEGSALGSLASAIEAIVGLAVAALFSVGAGFAYAGLLALITLPAIANLLILTGTGQQKEPVAAVVGSLLAAVAMVPFGTLWLHDGIATQDPLAIVVWLLCLGAAVSMGQLAALAAAARDLRRKTRQPPARRRWGLRQILLAMVVMSVVLAGLKWIGWLSFVVLLSLATAVVAHLAARRPLAWLVNRWADRRLSRRREERHAARST